MRGAVALSPENVDFFVEMLRLVHFIRCSEVQASVPGASNKLGE